MSKTPNRYKQIILGLVAVGKDAHDYTIRVLSVIHVLQKTPNQGLDSGLEHFSPKSQLHGYFVPLEENTELNREVASINVH
jgi:hypothetical protein